MVSDPGDNLSMLDLFLKELESCSLALEKGLVSVEKCEEQVKALVRAAHSLRGAARIVQLNGAAGLAQAMEEELTAVQHGARRLTPPGSITCAQPMTFFANWQSAAPRRFRQP